MKVLHLPLLLVLTCGITFGQVGKKNPKKSSPIQTEQVNIIDSVKAVKISKDLPTQVVAIKLKDSTIYNLKDMALARKKDSLWMRELSKSDLFEDVYASVTDMNFDAVEYNELPTELLKERLKELNARTPFNVEYNESLENVIKSYLKNRRNSLQRLITLSEYYFPMFEQELDRQKIPLELKYLAIVESALDPRATSRVGAKGLWQFMFSTGKMFGLDVSSYVDERSDPIMATEAAAKYLKSLNNSFNDWDLALAAYNSGPGNVSKAIRRSGGNTNYWQIRNNLPRETAGYVPAFLATMYIFEYAKEHGFTKESPKIHYVTTDTIRVKHQITLDQVAKLTNVEKEQLEFLNPSYKLGIIPVVKDENYMLRLPIKAIGTFVNNEDEIYAFAEAEIEKAEEEQPELFEQPNKVRYKVRRGDALGKIANRYDVSLSELKRWNGMRSNTIRVGQNLIIYPKKNVSAAPSKADIAKVETKSTSEKIYTVRNGDSLWSISQKFPGVSVQNIKSWNDISGSAIKPGTKLKIFKG